MATCRRYRCIECGVEGVVAGGQSALFAGPTMTYCCLRTNELVDVLTPYLTLPGDAEKFELSLKRRKLKPWSVGEPCPKCGGEIVNAPEDDGSFMEECAD
ncbi:hypothetical protein SAMN04488244_10596 [Vibrio hangzhouensis]|uniref:Uncharacterized protein n=1 Tax=Vibrio hangzhouensis TaxID=462991 RepID=A0A1H5W1G7_9VIBR|nr:hypothetical protein SAMN04488244_10596 [Vibrio hangzhouensis]